MTRKSDNKSSNATVAAVQQAHLASVQASKAAPIKPATPQKTAAAPTAKQAAVNVKPSTPSLSAKLSKPSTPQPSKVQTAPTKPVAQQASKLAAPASPVGRRASQSPIYEVYMVPSLFSEPNSWTANQAPCHAPHRAASPSSRPMKQLSKQNSSVTQTPVPKTAQPQKAAAKHATASKQKGAVKWNSAAGKQLILRPKNEVVLFRPLWMQVHAWAASKSTPTRGRSADKTSKQQRILQQKQRLAAQRKPEQVVAPKQQPNHQKPLSRQQSNSSSKPATPVPASRAPQQKAKPATPQKSASSPVDWQTNIWQDFYTSKHATFQAPSAAPQKAKPSTPVQKSMPHPIKAAKPNSAKNVKHASLKSTIPPPSEAKSPEIFSFVNSPTAGPLKPPSPIFVRKNPDGFGHPATFSRQNSSPATKISPAPIHAASLPKAKSNSSPTGNAPDYFASYMDRTANQNGQQQQQQRNAGNQKKQQVNK
ncbi:hypothetical protein HDU78_011165 [Chytriomyces hyalinus]|nr:hypothetical protein HDU78_011165 [Chytriomyces hyalinus]